ncbi:HNH endonuclease family protein [Pseudoclavibacter sp. AY1H1]|uniref:HNH endonuclease family protein n=1 Tax=Pseudoclavibacter sp. AY1H1 TaxID=2080584 RepID=UPI000CE76E7A|nr:HNH endonuclease family protein [Pseudoclavibacter sp. AY1H1]PPF32613.1 HNH endonuclease [Pseudoclavibacter sp. AY1H1]
MLNRRNTAMISLLAVAIAGWAVIGLSTPHHEATPAQPIGSAATVAPITSTMTAEEISQRLQVLAIAQQVEADPQTPAYERDEFGTRWADVDRNGCDTRNDILNRDLTDLVHKPGTNDCKVVAGTLHDPYTGQLIHVNTPQELGDQIDVDHIVPLNLAWLHGAATWTPEQRRNFANDPANLRAVDASTNNSKSDDGPSAWEPPNTDYRCQFAAAYVDVVDAYKLTLSPADHDSLTATLTRCLPTATT